MGKHLVKAVHSYIDCTNLNWYHKGPTHWFDQFGRHLHAVLLMYGRTANFKLFVHMYCGKPGNYGCNPVQICTNRDYAHKCSMNLFNPIGGNSDPVQTYSLFKIFGISYVWAIHFIWESIFPWLYASTLTVRIWIDITNVPPADLINLHSIQLMYGRTANLKWSVHMYCGILGIYGCMPLQKLYESGLRSKLFQALFQSFWW